MKKYGALITRFGPEYLSYLQCSRQELVIEVVYIGESFAGKNYDFARGTNLIQYEFASFSDVNASHWGSPHFGFRPVARLQEIKRGVYLAERIEKAYYDLDYHDFDNEIDRYWQAMVNCGIVPVTRDLQGNYFILDSKPDLSLRPWH